MLTFLFSGLGLATIGFYLYMAVAFYRGAGNRFPAWGMTKRAVYALTWPATVWNLAGNPAKD